MLLSILFNLLSADVEYTPYDTVVASESSNTGHSENYDGANSNFEMRLLAIRLKLIAKFSIPFSSKF